MNSTVNKFLTQTFLEHFHNLTQKVLLDSTAEVRMDESGKTLGIMENKDGMQRGKLASVILVFLQHFNLACPQSHLTVQLTLSLR